MKYSNLLLVGSSLLASTALSTVASSATLSLGGDTGVAGLFGVRSISAQAFAAGTTSSVTIGTNRLFIRFGQNTSTSFTASVAVTGAKFATSTTLGTTALAAVYTGASVPAVVENSAAAACTVLAGASTLLLTCNTTGGGAGQSVLSNSINGLVINNISFDNVVPLATAGASVSLDFTMTVGGVSFDTAPATTVITSRNSLTGTSTSGVPALIDVAAVPAAFQKLVGPTSTANIGTMTFTIGAAGTTFGRDLSVALVAATIVGSTEVKVTSPIFPATAVTTATANTSGITSAQIAGTATYSNTVTQFGAGFVTFAIPAANIADNYNVQVNFNGTTDIVASAAGTTTITFANFGSSTTTANNAAPPAITGTVAGLTRNGLSIDFNGLQPGTAQGARTYTSLVRVANTGSVAGTVAMVVRNETTGAVLGTYTSASIPGGASLQVSSAQIEAGAGITPSASVLYRVSVTGSITGYAQHVNWNQDSGFFSDLSGRRVVTTGTN